MQTYNLGNWSEDKLRAAELIHTKNKFFFPYRLLKVLE